MRVVLHASGLSWLDAEVGGFPSAGVVVARGAAGAGKTVFALGNALAALRRGPTCFVTNDSPQAVLSTCANVLEHDLQRDVAGGLTLLSFAPFFVHKARSLASVAGPIAELQRLVEEREIAHIVFDTFDPMLTWIDPVNAPSTARALIGQMQSWGISVLCMLGGDAPAIQELARIASGTIALMEDSIAIEHAGWCNVYDRSAPLRFVQGRGSVVPGPGEEPAHPSSSAIGSEADAISGRHTKKTWTSLITDRRDFIEATAEEWEAMEGDLFLEPSAGTSVTGTRSEEAPTEAPRDADKRVS